MSGVISPAEILPSSNLLVPRCDASVDAIADFYSRTLVRRLQAQNPSAPQYSTHAGTFISVTQVEHLTKTFNVHRRPAVLGAAVRSMFRRDYEFVRAVVDVSFSIERGERVGFLGPNGAGKTTTLKVLSGLLHPTAGDIGVNGFEPKQREREFLQAVTLVMGQKHQLIWDLPAAETYSLNKAIFDVPDLQYGETLEEQTELLDLEELATKPARQLSLGERMSGARGAPRRDRLFAQLAPRGRP